MYKHPSSSELLQGDVVSELSYPVFTQATFSVSRTSGRQEFSAQVAVKTSCIAIVSHSCDLVVYGSGPKRPALLFCPLIKVPENIRQSQDRYEILRRNEIDPTRPQFVNLFWYRQESPLPEDLIIDLSTIQPLPINTISSLAKRKILELDDRHRELLQTKLMHHFGRPESLT